MVNLDGKTVVSQLQNFIILQVKVDILYLELVKLCTQKILICLIWGNVFSSILSIFINVGYVYFLVFENQKIWIHEIKTIQGQLGI